MRAPRAPGGVTAAVVAFAIWGLFPLYLRPLQAVPALQVIAHRVVWSCLLLLTVLLVRGELSELRATLAQPSNLRRLAATATLISLNWLVYVWGVAHGRVLEASLGYFINPLVNVLLGIAVLSERLNRRQWVSVSIAGIAVAYLTLAAAAVPWIALTVAVSFAVYGLIRKIIHVEALPGLAAETLLLLPLAAGYLIWCEAQGSGAFGHSSLLVDGLLAGSGLVTAIPLLLFAYAARRIAYSAVGVLQYISPSLQLICGIVFFHEPFAGARAAGFVLIWFALAIYALDGLWRARPRPAEVRREAI